MDRAIVPTTTPVEVIDPARVTVLYDDDLERAGHAANAASLCDVFSTYHELITENTKRRHQNDLTLFSTYLQSAGIVRAPAALYGDPEAWRGMSYGLLKGFQRWLLSNGYAVSSIGVYTATIRQYCKLAGPEPEGANVLSVDALALIQTVKGIQGKEARNVDRDRQQQGIATRKGAKKALPTAITPAQALKMKKTSVPIQSRRKHDALLAARDALLVGLLVEHALRCGEVAALQIEHLNLSEDTITVYREKTDQTDIQTLKAHTRMAADDYLAQLRDQGMTSGPLFPGYRGKGISERAINERIAAIGQQLGVEGRLSPHDLRHFWTRYALKRKTPIDRVKRGGGWKSNAMVLRYAESLDIANEGVIVVGEEEGM